MPEVAFSMPTVVAVKIRGEGGRFPGLPDDGGLVKRFLRWSLDSKIYSVVPAGHSGGGSYLGFYEPKDAEKVRAWLLENGAIEDDEKAWARGR